MPGYHPENEIYMNEGAGEVKRKTWRKTSIMINGESERGLRGD